MEIPSGWRRTYSEWNSHDPYFNGRIYALDLIKEMAEALEKIYGEDGVTPYDLPVLKKFKEWK